MKKIHLQLVLALIVLKAFVSGAFAQMPQTISPIDKIEKMELYFEPRPSFVPVNLADTALSIHKRFQCMILVVLNDTTNISKIHVKMGSEPGSSNILPDMFFTFDASPTAPDHTYTRQGNYVYLGLGLFPPTPLCHASIILEYSNNTISNTRSISKN